MSSFCSAKATHIFSAKYIRILYIESAKTVNEMTLNELVKLLGPGLLLHVLIFTEDTSLDNEETSLMQAQFYLIYISYNGAEAHTSRGVACPTRLHVRPVKTQISLCSLTRFFTARITMLWSLSYTKSML